MNILHLSDIHFGRNDPYYGINDHFEKHDQILSELIDTVASLPKDLKPEHILFTGDAAWHGKVTEFAEASIWFGKLLRACGLKGKDISFCVGNHDVNIAYNCIGDSINDYSCKQIDDLYKYSNFLQLEPSINAYNDFCAILGVEPYVYPLNGGRHYSYSAGYKDIPFACGKTVRVVALNTSLLTSVDTISEDKMWLGQEQLKELIRYGIIPAGKEIAYTIMIYHHSDRFLHPDETNTYDGRCATLPLMIRNADIVLSGHTESSGRPCLTQQLGGGLMLSGGAAYYSDTHKNEFAMLYLNEDTKATAFFPYIYDNGWQDYDFCIPEISFSEKAALPESGQFIKACNLVFSTDGAGQEYSISFSGIEHTLVDKHGKEGSFFNSKKDLFNPFYIRIDGGDLRLIPNVTREKFSEAQIKFNEYNSFVESSMGKKQFWRLEGKGGTILASGEGFSKIRTICNDVETLKKIKILDMFFEAKLLIPDEFTQDDYLKIDLLTDIVFESYSDKVRPPEVIPIQVTKDRLEEILAKQRDGMVFLQTKKRHRIHINKVATNLKDVTFFSGPYKVDMDDVTMKYQTFCEGDVRRIEFKKCSGTVVYISTDDDRLMREKADLEEKNWIRVDDFGGFIYKEV